MLPAMDGREYHFRTVVLGDKVDDPNAPFLRRRVFTLPHTHTGMGDMTLFNDLLEHPSAYFGGQVKHELLEGLVFLFHIDCIEKDERECETIVPPIDDSQLTTMFGKNGFVRLYIGGRNRFCKGCDCAALRVVDLRVGDLRVDDCAALRVGDLRVGDCVLMTVCLRILMF